MSELISLDQLLTALPTRALVAFDGARQTSGLQLLARIAAWYSVLPGAPGAIALAHSDALEFAAALYAAWLRRLDVIVAADSLPATIASLQPQVLALVGEFAGASSVTAPMCVVEQIDEFARHLPLGSASRLILSTSGSSGEPTLVVKALRQLNAEVQSLEQCFGTLLADAKIAATVSHQHIYGLLFRVLWPLAAARVFEARNHVYLETVAAAAHGPLALVASPAHLKRIPDGLPWQSAGLRAVFSSGGPLTFAAAMATQSLIGVRPIEVYGSTETGGIAWRRQITADEPFELLPAVQMRQGQDQTLSLRSPHLPDAGWVELADYGECLTDGRVRLLGRADRIVKIEEKRVSLNAIERAARQGQWLLDARAVVLDGHRPHIALVAVPNAAAKELLLSAGRRTLSERVRIELGANFERVALPRRLRFVGAMPHNPQGKTSAASLQALFSQSETRPLLPFHDFLQRDTERAQVELLIGPDLYHFQGHFPDQPILPGVAQIDWAITLAKMIFDMPARLLRMEVLKFQAVITPGTRLLMELHWQAQRGVLEVRAHSEAGAHASARLVFSGDCHESD